MIYLQYTATPKVEPIKPDEDAGAYINCWINYKEKDTDKAKSYAEKAIDECGWIITSLDSVEIIDKDYYANDEDDSHLQYFEQAELDDEVVTIYSYPLVNQEQED
jgi:hypothetical protein